MPEYRDKFYNIIPKPQTRSQRTEQAHMVKRYLVLSMGNNPTFSYYLEERLNRSAYPNDVRDLTQSLSDIDPEGVFVIICRYIRPRQLQWLYRNRKRIAGAALFIDDDLAAIFASAKGEFAYKAYITVLGIVPLLILNRVLTEVWVSTPALGRVLAKNTKNIKVIGPLPSMLTYHSHKRKGAHSDHLVMAFHTDRCHETEHVFLLPIVKEALRKCKNLRFEVVATGRIARMWLNADLPADRLEIRENQTWADYLEATRESKIDIFLVPLARNSFNDVRAGTKRIDAVRLGAAAVFSRCHVYQQNGNEEEIFVGYDSAAWVEAICQLAEDSALRLRAHKASARAIRCMTNAEIASPPFHIG